MNVINSARLSQDESDVTIINHSLLYGGNDESITSCLPVVRRIQQANHTQSVNTPSNSDDKQGYAYINHNFSDTIRQIEVILNFYRQDLKQDSNTQLDCNRKLITRLVDFIRPIYSSYEQQMKNLDDLHEDISILHDKKFLEVKEKNSQLQNKIRHLQKSIITTPIEDDDRDSLITNLYRMNNMFDYEECIEIEEETKRLQNLVQTQREQIDKLVELVSQIEINKNEKYPNSYSPLKKCSVCNWEFPIHFSELEITIHIGNCLSTANIVYPNIPPESNEIKCPYCNERLTNNDELVNYQHLSQCYNEMTGNF